ncbi:hypothetical protein ACJRO7_028100 [Eucalyptus globulus]|uniref:CCHC-type domain-containing protein n=1 Tax=Eucalyptus globulus TaxID=34317 RepID=A0ABD3JYE2_EUCGL
MTGGRFQIPPNRKGGIEKSGSSQNGQCRLCGRWHGTSPCPRRPGVCFGCGQQGHMIRDCPNRPRGQPQLPPPPPLGQNRGFAPQIAPQGGLNRPPAQGRTYAITRGQAEDAPNVITGTVLLNDHAAYALFDLGTTHSFITEQFVKLIGLSPELLESVVSISTPLKDKVLVALGCSGCKLMIGEREGKIDLIVLAMYDFDVIIGMDWLTKQRAKMNCYCKSIQFNPLGGESFEFTRSRGEPSIALISSLEATRLLDRGCQSYLATVVDTTVEELKIEDISVVQEFPDVFPKELPGLPPEREIEFVIELVPGTEPISKAPYRMALSELKELKVQMQELLDKGFIHPSASPWGAPVLFVKKKDGSLRLCIDYHSIK